MVDVKHKLCLSEGCMKHPSFNTSDKSTAIYCKKHKQDNMIDVRSKRCLSEGCMKHPSFNTPGESRPLYCGEHKQDNMVDVINKRCLSDGCMKRPAYNAPGESRPLYCGEHKQDTMVDVINKRCLSDGCMKRPTCNAPGESIPLYCKEHKQDTMINVTNKRCLSDGCTKHPNFNTPGESRPLYCKEHKQDNMIDVKHKLCLSEGCIKQPSFNTPGESIPLYCKEHKQDHMVDVLNKRCRSPWCDIQVASKKYDGYCLFCFVHNFPDIPVSRNYKTKERLVVEHVLSTFPEFTWVVDKRIADGCSRRRPDLMLDLGYQVIIVEIDENQHANYDCSCENKRLMELSRDVGHRPLVFIRFNPDDYIDSTGNKVKSCWTTTKNGLCAIKKKSATEWQERLLQLNQQIVYWSRRENMTNKTVEVVQLFY